MYPSTTTVSEAPSGMLEMVIGTFVPHVMETVGNVIVGPTGEHVTFTSTPKVYESIVISALPTDTVPERMVTSVWLPLVVKGSILVQVALAELTTPRFAFTTTGVFAHRVISGSELPGRGCRTNETWRFTAAGLFTPRAVRYAVRSSLTV